MKRFLMIKIDYARFRTHAGMLRKERDGQWRMRGKCADRDLDAAETTQ
jgi:hypothetical protein